MSIKNASEETGIKYSASKYIIKVYKSENRIGKKEHKPKVNYIKKSQKFETLTNEGSYTH